MDHFFLFFRVCNWEHVFPNVSTWLTSIWTENDMKVPMLLISLSFDCAAGKIY